MPPALAQVHLRNTHRLIPSRYPPTGILDVVSSPEDLELMFELESWTNDRISAQFGVIQNIARDEWVTGRQQATVIMAAFCHPSPTGPRFSGSDRGAWYAAFDLATAQAEIVYHRGQELMEIGVLDARLEMREYVADFRNDFHDIRANDRRFRRYYDPDSYIDSQSFARQLFENGSNGILYRSVRRAGGQCVACFRPPLVLNVRPAAHFQFRWRGDLTPTITKLSAARP
jgi:hypothetical protein